MKPLRICKHCKLEAFDCNDLESFVKNKRAKHGRENYCKECAVIKCATYRSNNIERYRAHSLKWARDNKDKAKDMRLKREYGISLDEYNLILLSQDSRCKICDVHADSIDRGLLVDHCHKDGHVRGLLCDPCNKALGYLNDSKDNLLKSIIYLDDNGKEVEKEVNKQKGAMGL